MPAFAPLYAIGGERSRLEWLTVNYLTHPSSVAAVLPPPLVPDRAPEVVLWVARSFGATFEDGGTVVRSMPGYEQSGMCVRCTLDGEPGCYPMASYIVGLNSGFSGRELYGLPKKQVRSIRFDVGEGTDDSVTAVVVAADGSTILTVRGRTSAVTPPPLVPVWFANQYTLKVIPRADGQGFDINRLVQLEFEFAHEPGTRNVDASVRFARSVSDPLDLLPVVQVTGSAVGVTNLYLGYGRYRNEVTDFRTFGRP